MSGFIVPLESSLTREFAALEAPRAPETPSAPAGPEGVSFENLLENVVQRADESIQVAEARTDAFARGQSQDLHGTMLALEQADIRFRLMVEMRNHLLEAYREVMRMTV